jgi:hypothetical protein
MSFSFLERKTLLGATKFAVPSRSGWNFRIACR